MYQDFRDKYKVTNDKNPYDRMVEKYKFLRNDPSFLQQSIQLGELVYKKFHEKYPNIQFDFRFRVKSQRSIDGKILKHELNRMGILSMIRDLTEEESVYFDKLILKKLDYNEYDEKTKNKILSGLKFVDDLKDEQLESVEQFFSGEQFDSEVKKMLLRNFRYKIKNSNREKKEKDLEAFDERILQDEGDPFNIHEIETMSDEVRNKLENPDEYSKLFDIMGMKGVIGEIPNDFTSESEAINKLLEYRKTGLYNQSIYSRILLEDELAIELGKEFLQDILKDKDVKDGFNSIKDRRKSILKSNGYRAEHATVRANSNPYKTIEIQIKSKYRERIASEGTAAHDQRDGKIRNMPKLPVDDRFVNELRYRVPRYYLVRFSDGKLHECGLFENTCYYYAKQINQDEEMFSQLYNSMLVEEGNYEIVNDR